MKAHKYKVIDKFLLSKDQNPHQQNINMSGSKSTIQLLQSNSRNLSNEEISF
jgi:hypothetical protein